jgi:hypothetical protein
MDAKKARRNAKSSLTRRSNNLYSMIENNRPVEEITEALELVEIDYKTVVKKHEALVEKVDDEEFAKEEKWIEDCREKTLILKFRAKDSVTRLSQRLLPNVVLKFYQIGFFLPNTCKFRVLTFLAACSHCSHVLHPFWPFSWRQHNETVK